MFPMPSVPVFNVLLRELRSMVIDLFGRIEKRRFIEQLGLLHMVLAMAHVVEGVESMEVLDVLR